MTRGSILQDAQRKYLRSEGYYLDEEYLEKKRQDCPVSEKHARSRLNTQVSDATAYREVIEVFRKDLLAVTQYNLNEGGQRWYNFESVVLPQAKGELKRLKQHIESLIDIAEDDESLERRASVQEAVWKLYDDMEHYPPETVLQEGDENQLVEVFGSDEWVSEREEAEERKGALVSVLRKEGLTDILEYLSKNGKTELPKKRVDGDGQYWKGLATQFLVNELSLAEKDDTWQNKVRYELNDRGKAVCGAWNRLKRVALEEYPEKEPRVAAHYLLKIHFEGDKWTDRFQRSTDIDR